MSYTLPPDILMAAAPGVADDITKGIVIGQCVIVTGVTPRTVYKCTSNAVGAATWLQVAALLLAVYGGA